ncbi:MAG TPA: response regulator transcription factor [Terrabacter sp.]|nr:response regulator transcription factor [Terrabacter sp.]
MRIVVCDDHRLLLEALGASLVARGHDVVALVVTPEEAVCAVTEHAPDVCLLDLHFPEGNSLTALEEMTRRQPDTKVVVFSATADPQSVAGTLSLGAAGFLRKSMSVDEICVMISRAVEGQVAVEASLLKQAFLPPSPSDPMWVLRFLTDREWDALQCITQGLTTQQIARRLGVQASTARTHVQNLLTKLGVHSRLEAAALVADLGGPSLWPARLRS